MKTKVIVILGLLVLSTTGLFAQKNTRFALELNSGASFSVSQIPDTKTKAGFGFESLLHYRFMPHTGIYAGWGWNRLAAENSFAGNDVCFEETGYIVGLQFMHPIKNSRISAFIRAAGLYNHIETENSEGEIAYDTQHGLGYQLAAGVNTKLIRNWSLNIGLKYNSLTRNTNFQSISEPVSYHYISAVRIGIVKQF
jgi:opacity protein-like surface antigen